MGASGPARIAMAMSHLGQIDVADLTLSPGEGQMQIELFGLPPRDDRFEVRTVRADGTPGARAATVTFRVLPAL